MYRTYIMKLWLATMIAAPLVLFALILMIDPDFVASYPIVKLLVFIIIVGFILSIPTLLCVSLLSNLFERNIKNTRTLKVVTIIMCVIGIVATFSLLYDSDSYDQMKLAWGWVCMFLYCVSIVIFGIIFKIRDEIAE